MIQGSATPLIRQLATYRQQAVVAPTMLDDGTLSPSHVAEVVAQEGYQGRKPLPSSSDDVDLSAASPFGRWLLPRCNQSSAPVDDRQRPNTLFPQYRQLLQSPNTPT